MKNTLCHIEILIKLVHTYIKCLISQTLFPCIYLGEPKSPLSMKHECRRCSDKDLNITFTQMMDSFSSHLQVVRSWGLVRIYSRLHG